MLRVRLKKKNSDMKSKVHKKKK